MDGPLLNLKFSFEHLQFNHFHYHLFLKLGKNVRNKFLSSTVILSGHS